MLRCRSKSLRCGELHPCCRTLPRKRMPFIMFDCLNTVFNGNVGAQVVYPALDLKVKNVTRAYTVEHEDEASAGALHE